MRVSSVRQAIPVRHLSPTAVRTITMAELNKAVRSLTWQNFQACPGSIAWSFGEGVRGSFGLVWLRVNRNRRTTYRQRQRLTANRKGMPVGP